MEEKSRILSPATTGRRRGMFARIINGECVYELAAVTVVAQNSAVFGHHGSVGMPVAADNHRAGNLREATMTAVR